MKIWWTIFTTDVRFHKCITWTARGASDRPGDQPRGTVEEAHGTLWDGCEARPTDRGWPAHPVYPLPPAGGRSWSRGSLPWTHHHWEGKGGCLSLLMFAYVLLFILLYSIMFCSFVSLTFCDLLALVSPFGAALSLFWRTSWNELWGGWWRLLGWPRWARK